MRVLKHVQHLATSPGLRVVVDQALEAASAIEHQFHVLGVDQVPPDGRPQAQAAAGEPVSEGLTELPLCDRNGQTMPSPIASRIQP